MELKLTLTALAVSIIGLLTPDEQSQILIASIIGSGLGGYMGSYYFPGKSPGPITLRKRWATNLATGTCFGPMAAVWLQPHFAHTPLIFLSLAASGIIGAIGILLLTILLPPAFRWLQTRFFPSETPPATPPPTPPTT